MTQNVTQKLAPLRFVDGFLLKLIALVTMTIDHTANVLGCGKFYWLMRSVGRLAFPIYVFLLVEGYFHTKDIKKYAGRLALMMVLSELPFDLMCAKGFPDLAHQNVMFTLLLGLSGIYLLDHGTKWLESKLADKVKLQIFSTLFCLAVFLSWGILGDLLNVDYGGAGVLLILAFFALREQVLSLFLVSAFIMFFFFGTVELPGLAAFLPISLYNGKRGPMPGGKIGQWFFYLYYPLHIALLVGLASAMGVASYTIF